MAPFLWQVKPMRATARPTILALLILSIVVVPPDIGGVAWELRIHSD
jgi:hypothetical protein